MALNINEKLLPGFFESGDTHTTGNNYAGGIGGFITSSRTNLCFDIIVPKSLKNISSVSITGLRVRVRSVEGTYLITSGGGTGYADLITNQDSTGTALAQSCTNITANIITDNQIRIQAAFNGGIYTTNNVPVAVEYRNLGITFS